MKSAIILGLVLLVAGGVLFYVSQPGGVAVPGVVATGDRGYIRDRTWEFLEDIKFKDFAKASTYHLESTQKARDIPNLLQRVFKIPHEVLDIQDFEIIEVELDTGKTRGRVRTLVRYHVLGDREVREKEDAQRDTEMLFYWFKQPDGSWVMELESSLRGH
ncbi:MAG: hypothetical protein KC933_08845 [Myxococcales bacterium]|nr:hypothetical protein [Myxococcales bacterium]MCB9645686.1 hypothetical protein [Deltaproteobacteria bacterium]